MKKTDQKSHNNGRSKNKKQLTQKVSRKYVLEVNEKQTALISHALDIYSRLEAGHLEWIFSMIEWKHYDKLPEAKPLLEALKLLLTGYPPHQHPGIGMLSNNATAAWDLHRVIRHRLAWDREPQGGMGVFFDEPTSTVGKEPLATIKLSDKPSTVYLVHQYDEFREREYYVACTLSKERAEAMVAEYQATNKIMGEYETGEPSFEFSYGITEKPIDE